MQGIEGFRSEVVKRMPQQELETASPQELIQKQWERRDYLGVHPQKQEGFSFVGVHIPVGRVQADDMDELALLADTWLGRTPAHCGAKHHNSQY